MPAIARILASRADVEPAAISVAAALAAMRPGTATVGNLAGLCGLQGHEVSRALVALGKLGLVEIVGKTVRRRSRKLATISVPLGWIGNADVVAIGAFCLASKAARSHDAVITRFGWSPPRLVKAIRAGVSMGAIEVTSSGRLGAAP